jgi:hypothetical protein
MYATSQGPKFYNQVLGMQWLYSEDPNMEERNLNKNKFKPSH